MPVLQTVSNSIPVLILSQYGSIGRMEDEDCDERFTMHQAVSRKLQPFVQGYIYQAQIDSGSIHYGTVHSFDTVQFPGKITNYVTSRVFHKRTKIGNIGIITNFVFLYISSFLLYL